MIVPSSAHHHADIAAHAIAAIDIADTIPDGVHVSDADDDNVISDGDSDDDSTYDACDELFKQGQLLRQLRQLEREDEALREQDRQEQQQQVEEEEVDSNTLDYNKYLQNQEGKYDDYKHVNFQYVDFGIISNGAADNDDSNDDNDDSNNSDNEYEQNTPLVIEQDRTVGKGGFVWDAGFILAESVLRMEQRETEWLLPSNRSQRIIELGAGTGVTSLMIARARPTATVHLTDLPQLQPLLEKNCTTCQNATHGVLEWGKPVNGEPYDVILAADVVAGIYDSSGLAKTIYDLSHEKTVVYLAYRHRLSGLIDRFESYMNELFTRVERRPADSTNKSPNVFILCISGKRVYEQDKNENEKEKEEVSNKIKVIS